MYAIFPEQYKLAEKMKLRIFPSDDPKKKLDVYDNNGLFLKRIGDMAYGDFFIYKHGEGKKIADAHRLKYYARHKKGIEERKLGEILSWVLLWNGKDTLDQFLGHDDFKPKKTIYVSKDKYA
jgi:hypothetical protein